jgi:hypothetical protein
MLQTVQFSPCLETTGGYISCKLVKARAIMVTTLVCHHTGVQQHILKQTVGVVTVNEVL